MSLRLDEIPAAFPVVAVLVFGLAVMALPRLGRHLFLRLDDALEVEFGGEG